MTAEKRPEDIARDRRNKWLAAALVAFVVIVGVTTAIRIQDADFSGDNSFYFSGKAPDFSEKSSASGEGDRE